MPGTYYIFHVAALKKVPSSEFCPMKTIKTNVTCFSTDKASYPINAMGITKFIEEKIALVKFGYSGDTKICCTRYSNVMYSRDSVIPLWIDQISRGYPITLSEPKMIRFIMSLEEAVDLVLFAFEHSHNGDILVLKVPACTIRPRPKLYLNSLVV